MPILATPERPAARMGRDREREEVDGPREGTLEGAPSSDGVAVLAAEEGGVGIGRGRLSSPSSFVVDIM